MDTIKIYPFDHEILKRFAKKYGLKEEEVLAYLLDDAEEREQEIFEWGK